MKKSCLLISLLFVFSSAMTQASLRLQWAKDSIEIGQQVDLIITIELEDDVSILAIPTFFVDTLYSALQSFMAAEDTSRITPQMADFDIVSLGGWEDSNNDGLFTSAELRWDKKTILGKSVLEHRIIVTLWDPGENVALYPPYLIEQNDEQKQLYQQGQAVIKVTAPKGMSTSLDSLDMAPIRQIQEEPLSIADFIPYLVGLALMLTFIAIVLWYRKRTKEVPLIVEKQEPEIALPAHVIALESLDILQAKKLWQSGYVKEYQSELTQIIRRYLEDRYGIDALEKTTREITKDLTKANLSATQHESLNRILTVADLVKFAKALPEEDLHDRFLTEAKHFVQETSIPEPIQKEGRV